MDINHSLSPYRIPGHSMGNSYLQPRASLGNAQRCMPIKVHL